MQNWVSCLLVNVKLLNSGDTYVFFQGSVEPLARMKLGIGMSRKPFPGLKLFVNFRER